MPTFHFSPGTGATSFSGPSSGIITGFLTDGPDQVAFTYSYSGGSGAIDSSDLIHRGTYLNSTSVTSFIPATGTMRFYTATNGTQAVTLDGANLFFNSIANVTMHALTTGGGTIAFDGGLFHNDVLTGIRFNIGSGGGFDLDFITTLAVLCYCAGTSIATPDGPRAVETLAPGDMVRTAGGRDVPVKWLGKLPVDTRLGHPDAVNPIRITAGALGGGLPERDLRVSADHAIAIDGYLINAGALVNGQTIYQEAKMPMDGFTYYHIETEAHELLLAEGVAAESFIDYAGRAAFENGDESSASITEMNLPRISTARLVPDHIRARLIPKIAAE